jgi:hypothetical protein
VQSVRWLAGTHCLAVVDASGVVGVLDLSGLLVQLSLFSTVSPQPRNDGLWVRIWVQPCGEARRQEGVEGKAAGR